MEAVAFADAVAAEADLRGNHVTVGIGQPGSEDGAHVHHVGSPGGNGQLRQVVAVALSLDVVVQGNFHRGFLGVGVIHGDVGIVISVSPPEPALAGVALHPVHHAANAVLAVRAHTHQLRRQSILPGRVANFQAGPAGFLGHYPLQIGMQGQHLGVARGNREQNL